MRRTLYYGDNLEVMRQLPDEHVDLIYLDPPFNSSADYNVNFREQSGEAPAPRGCGQCQPRSAAGKDRQDRFAEEGDG